MAGFDFEDRELARLLAQDEGADPKKLPADLKLIGHILSNPKKLPMLLGEVSRLKPKKELRIALAAVQVDCEIKMHSDLDRYQTRKYAANVLELAIFGDEFLDGDTALADTPERKKKGR